MPCAGMAEPSSAKKQHADTNAHGGRRWLRWAIGLVGLALVVLAAADSLGAFRSTPYTAVPHGSHNHYVPDRCKDARAGDFPMRPPREGERITCSGQFVQK